MALVSCFLGKYFIPELFLQPQHGVWSCLLQLWDFQGASREIHNVPSIRPLRLCSVISSKLEEMNIVFILFHKLPSYRSYKNGWYPSLLSFALMKTITKSNLEGKKGLFQVIKGSQRRNSGLKLKQRL